MTAYEYEKIKAKIEKAKETEIRMKSLMEQTEKDLKENYTIESIEECESKIEELDSLIKTEEKKLSSLMDKLENATDWNKV